MITWQVCWENIKTSYKQAVICKRCIVYFGHTKDLLCLPETNYKLSLGLFYFNFSLVERGKRKCIFSLENTFILKMKDKMLVFITNYFKDYEQEKSFSPALSKLLGRMKESLWPCYQLHTSENFWSHYTWSYLHSFGARGDELSVIFFFFCYWMLE